MYIKTPLGGRTPHEYTRNSRKVRAVIITEKGHKFKPTMKKPGRYPMATISNSNFNSWYHWTSEDACSADTSGEFYDRGYFKSPGNWNVFVSKVTSPASAGVYFDSYSFNRYSTFGGKNVTFGVVDEYFSGISSNGCSAEMPISDADFHWRVNMKSEGSGNSFGSYTTTFSDDFGTSGTRTATAGGSMSGAFRVSAQPVDVFCGWMNGKIIA